MIINRFNKSTEKFVKESITLWLNAYSMYIGDNRQSDVVQTVALHHVILDTWKTRTVLKD